MEGIDDWDKASSFDAAHPRRSTSSLEAMRDWTAIPTFDRVDLTESFILSWAAEIGVVAFEVDFALAAGHPDHREPRPGERACFRRGILKFPNVRSIVGLPPMSDVRSAVDAAGEIDYGHFDSFVEMEAGQFKVSVDFGIFHVTSDQPTIAVHADRL